MIAMQSSATLPKSYSSDEDESTAATVPVETLEKFEGSSAGVVVVGGADASVDRVPSNDEDADAEAAIRRAVPRPLADGAEEEEDGDGAEEEDDAEEEEEEEEDARRMPSIETLRLRHELRNAEHVIEWHEKRDEHRVAAIAKFLDGHFLTPSAHATHATHSTHATHATHSTTVVAPSGLGALFAAFAK